SFYSVRDTLVPGLIDNNSASDVFLYDLATGTNTLVTHTASALATTGNGGSGDAQLSGDGRFVVYDSYATDLVAGFIDGNGFNISDVFLYDALTGGTTLVSRSAASAAKSGNGRSAAASISGDGRFVAFDSYATNLINGYVSGNSSDNSFVYDRLAGT